MEAPCPIYKTEPDHRVWAMPPDPPPAPAPTPSPTPTPTPTPGGGKEH